MFYLFDTNALSDFIREHPLIDQHLAAIGPQDRVIICAIVRGETLYGIDRLPVGRRRNDLRRKADKALAGLQHEPMPADVGDHYSRIKMEREQRGLPMDENDLWIAATALALKAVLVTRDSDFANVQGLTVEDWTV